MAIHDKIRQILESHDEGALTEGEALSRLLGA